jgi:integrase
MEMLPTLKPVFNRLNLKNKSGNYSLYIRVYLKNEARYIKVPVPTKISKEHWSGKDNNWVKNTHPFGYEINQKIAQLLGRLNDIIKMHYLQNKPLCLATLLSQYKRKGDGKSFSDYIQHYLRNPPDKLQAATIEKYRAFAKHFNAFKPKVYFSEISPQLVAQFKYYLEETLQLQGSTVKSYFDKLKKVVLAAEKEGFLETRQCRFLFDEAKIKINQAKRVYLEPEEIIRLKEAKFCAEEQALQRDRDLFLLLFYTGYYYNDLKVLKKAHLVEQPGIGYFLIGERDKNGNTTIVPLYKFPNALEILKRYKGKRGNEFFFDDSVFIEAQAYNRNLKKVALKAGISKELSNKVARHSNAQMWVRYGAKRPVVSKILGHTKESSTNHYYKVDLREIVEGVKDIDFENMGL